MGVWFGVFGIVGGGEMRIKEDELSFKAEGSGLNKPEQDRLRYLLNRK